MEMIFERGGYDPSKRSENTVPEKKELSYRELVDWFSGQLQALALESLTESVSREQKVAFISGGYGAWFRETFIPHYDRIPNESDLRSLHALFEKTPFESESVRRNEMKQKLSVSVNAVRSAYESDFPTSSAGTLSNRGGVKGSAREGFAGSSPENSPRQAPILEGMHRSIDA